MLFILGGPSFRSGWPRLFRGATFFFISAMFAGLMRLARILSNIWKH
jgi:hypothetical protein